MSSLPAQVSAYIATLTPLPKGLTVKEQWQRVTVISKCLVEFCAAVSPEVHAAAASAAMLQMEPWPLAIEKKAEKK